MGLIVAGLRVWDLGVSRLGLDGFRQEEGFCTELGVAVMIRCYRALDFWSGLGLL